MFSLDADASGEVVAAVRAVTPLPIGAKLSPNLVDAVPVAAACLEAGADFLTLTNTVWGAGIDIERRRPLLSGVVGGYSGPALKPIAMRFVIEVRRAFPEAAIVGCGGVVGGRDIVEFLMAGANAVAAGTIHFAEPRAGVRLLTELQTWMVTNRVRSITALSASMP
jgi:dihydroorotate dehydrogenase (NAD+) catalytic subunit